MKQIDFNHQLQAAVATNPLLSLLGQGRRDTLASKASLWSYDKGEELYRAGDKANCSWAIVSGQIKVWRESNAGQRLIIEVVTAGEICGAMCYAEEDCLTFSASAMEEGVGLRFPTDELTKAADANPPVLRALLRDICRRLYHAQHMRSLAMENVTGRVACVLIYLQEKFGNDIPHGRATLAGLAGTTVESAIRATRVLSEKGFLTTVRNKVCVTSLSELKQFAHKDGA